MNQVILVGRVNKIDSDNNLLELEVNSIKNVTDIIKVSLGKELNTALTFISKGVVVGIKGRIDTSSKEMKVLVEKITFINKGNSDE